MKETTRHSWAKEGHPYRHIKVCTRCGCIKDAKVIGRTIYRLANGEESFKVPPCLPAQKN